MIYCGFYLCFPDNYWSIFFSHACWPLYAFFCKMSLLFIFPFLNQNIWLLLLSFYVFWLLIPCHGTSLWIFSHSAGFPFTLFILLYMNFLVLNNSHFYFHCLFLRSYLCGIFYSQIVMMPLALFLFSQECQNISKWAIYEL